MSNSNTWQDVSKRSHCTICSSHSWRSHSTDGKASICHREFTGHDIPDLMRTAASFRLISEIRMPVLICQRQRSSLAMTSPSAPMLKFPNALSTLLLDQLTLMKTIAERRASVFVSLHACVIPLRIRCWGMETLCHRRNLSHRLGSQWQRGAAVLTTIHSAQGIKFGHLWTPIDMTRRNWQHSHVDERAQRRVFYLDAMRCSPNLHLPKSPRAYHYRELI